MELKIGKYIVNISLIGFTGCQNKSYVYKSFVGGNSLSQGVLGYTVNYDGLQLMVSSDFIGGHRIYYWQTGLEIHISDDIQKVLIASEAFPISNNELIYYNRHGYCLAGRTFREGLFRIPPSSTLVLNEKGLHIEDNWPLGEIKRFPDLQKYKNVIQEAVDSSLRQLFNTHKKVILCFSGGKDSLYLATRMQKLGIEFDLVYWDVNKEAQRTARLGAKQLGKNLITIDVSDYSEELKRVVAEEMFFDHHFSRIHYVGCQEIVKRYGNEIVLVNGQNSDSILTYGPSETKWTSYWKRYLMYGDCFLRKWIYKTIIEIGFRRRFVVPKTEEDMNRAFLDHFKYCLILDKNEPEDYKKYLNDYITDIKQRVKFSSQNNLWMYLKISSHIYGSDSQVVINSARHFGLDVLLPFSTEEVIRAALTFKEDRMELVSPKYALNI